MIKKSRVTILVIFSLVLLIAFSLILYLNNKIGNVEEAVKLQSSSSGLSIQTRNYVNTCLKTVGEDALKFVGLQGGYFDKPRNSVDSKGIFYDPFHALYIQDGQNAMPSLQTIELELSKYVNKNLQNCVEDFEPLESLGYGIEGSKFTTSTSITKSGVLFNLNFPLTVSQDQKSAKLEDFFVTIPSRLNLIYGLASGITEEQLTHLDQICISCLIDLGDENNLYFEIVPRKQDINLIVVEDNQIKIDNEPYLFIFGFDHST